MPRKPEQFEEIREKSREKILDAALDLFANKGYDATSIDSIAKKAGVSKGLIYNYYDSKKAMLLAIFDQAMQIGDAVMVEVKKEKDPDVRIRNMVEGFFAMVDQQPGYLKLLMVLSLQPGVMEDMKTHMGQIFERNSRFISSAFAKGREKDTIKGFMLDALFDGVLLNYIRYGKHYPINAIKKRIIEEYCLPQKKGRTKKGGRD